MQDKKVVYNISMKDRPPTWHRGPLFPRKQELAERRRLAAIKRAGEQHAKRKADFNYNSEEFVERVKLAKTFTPGDIVEMSNLQGVVVTPDFIDQERGLVRVRFGRAKPISYNPRVLRNVTKEMKKESSQPPISEE